MTTLFELSSSELFSLLSQLRPDLTAIEEDDAPSMQSKVTEWLLLNNLPTLYKFTKKNNEWEIPSKGPTKSKGSSRSSCYNASSQSFTYQPDSRVIVNQQPTGDQPDPALQEGIGAACCWRRSENGLSSMDVSPMCCAAPTGCTSKHDEWKTPLMCFSSRVHD